MNYSDRANDCVNIEFVVLFLEFFVKKLVELNVCLFDDLLT